MRNTELAQFRSLTRFEKLRQQKSQQIVTVGMRIYSF